MKDLLKKKRVTIPIGILVYLILFGVLPKLAGILTLAGSIGGGAYLFIKNEKFKTRNKFIKGLTAIGLVFAILFGIGAIQYDPVEAQKIKVAQEQAKQEKITLEEKEKKEAEEKAKLEAEQKKKEEEEKTKEVQASAVIQGDLKVHFINVGQADSILVQQGNEAMLIDAGNNADDKTVKSYLDSVGVKELSVVIGTHAHEDHIGGMDYIINSLKVGKIYIPKQVNTTKTFEDVVTATKNKGLQFTAPKVNETFNIGQAKCIILAPNADKYEDINDSSIVVKVEFGQNSFLLTGDAEAVSEMEMVKAGANLKADVLKVGHHGSKSSTCANFLSSVSPKYAVISVGKGNDYGHPAQSTMDRIKGANVQVFRTDENGTIVATSNGKDIIFNVQPATYNGVAEKSTTDNSATNNTSNNSNQATQQKSTVTPQPAPQQNSGVMVWLAASGDCYHSKNNCGRMNPSKARQVSLEEAKRSYSPCSKCHPPQ